LCLLVGLDGGIEVDTIIADATFPDLDGGHQRPDQSVEQVDGHAAVVRGLRWPHDAWRVFHFTTPSASFFPSSNQWSSQSANQIISAPKNDMDSNSVANNHMEKPSKDAMLLILPTPL